MLPSYHTLAMPTCGFFMSSSVRPVPIEHGLRGALGAFLGQLTAIFVELTV